jgi:hypothetical protein
LYGWWPLAQLFKWENASAGSVVDWMMLIATSLALAAPMFAALALVISLADLWRRRPLWQVGLGALLALAVFYAFRDFP